MRGVVLSSPIALQVVPKALSAGLVVNATSDSVLRLVPPLVISDEAIREAARILSAVIGDTQVDQTLGTSAAVAAY